MVSFGFDEAHNCELTEESSSKCWKLAAGVTYICMAASGVGYAVFGMLATLKRIKHWRTDWLNFLLAVRIAYWIYLVAVLIWFFFSSAFLTPTQLGWVPYTLFANAVVIGTGVALHLRVWVNKLEKARIIEEVLTGGGGG